jgi:hypothetical protein
MLNAGNEFIDRLLLKYHISLRAVSDFTEGHREDLQQAGNIFDLKEGRDKKLCLAVFRLLSEKHAEDISESFCSRYNIDDTSVDDLFFEQNKLFLLSAFIYNPSFFAMSWNLCGIIQSQLAFQAKPQGATDKPQIAAGKVIRFPRTVVPLAASGAEEELQEIWTESIKQENVFGKLRIFANNKDGAGKVLFRFRFHEYRSEPPFYLLVHYISNGDNSEHTAELNIIAVNNNRKAELVIASEPEKGVRYGDGLTITSLEILRHG